LRRKILKRLWVIGLSVIKGIGLAGR